MNIIPRSAWGARGPKARKIMRRQAYADVFIHHTATVPSAWRADEGLTMRGVQKMHIDTRKWADIGYSFVVFPSGNVYEGRGFGVVGAHTEGHNSTSHGICLVGNFETEVPTEAALDAVRQLIAHGQGDGWIAATPNIRGHRNVGATACPGANLYSRLKDIRAAGLPTDVLTAHTGTGHNVTMDRATYDRLLDPKPAILAWRRA